VPAPIIGLAGSLVCCATLIALETHCYRRRRRRRNKCRSCCCSQCRRCLSSPGGIPIHCLSAIACAESPSSTSARQHVPNAIVVAAAAVDADFDTDYTG